jgi:hypothetical protein
MKLAKVRLQSVSPYSQSRFHNEPKLDKELADDYEKRTWVEKGHYTKDGSLFISPMAFSNSLKEAAKYLSIQIPGKGKATFTKHFEAGVLVTDPLILPIKKAEVQGEWCYVNADGIRGSGKRVMRRFPVVPEWEGEVTYYILDDIITQDVFTQVLVAAGNLIGIGRFRPRNLGYYGRYQPTQIEWMDNV